VRMSAYRALIGISSTSVFMVMYPLA
jgi:hypothetical protein